MTVKKKMNVIFKDEEEYEKFKNGKTRSKKGLRTEDGKLSSLPDIEEVDESEEMCTEPVGVVSTSQAEMEVGEQIIYAILEGLYEAVKEVLSDEQNRQAIASLAKNWWGGKLVPGIKQTWISIKDVVYGVKCDETKAWKLLMEKESEFTSISNVEYTQLGEVEEVQDNRHRISPEEYQQQVNQIKVLAILLADRIKKLSNSCIAPNAMTDEEYMIQQDEIKVLTAEDVIGSVKLLMVHKDFSFNDSAAKMFSEFIAGNLIVNEQQVPIASIKDTRKLL